MQTILTQMLEQYQTKTLTEKKNAIKEVVQEIALCGLSRADFFKHVAFYGGTALRIFYGLDRFSEDLAKIRCTGKSALGSDLSNAQILICQQLAGCGDPGVEHIVHNCHTHGTLELPTEIVFTHVHLLAQ